MKRHLLSILAFACLGLAVLLAGQWINRQGQLRNTHWQAPAPLTTNYLEMLPLLPEPARVPTSRFMALLERPLFSETRRPPPPPPPPPPPVPVDILSNAQLSAIYAGEQLIGGMFGLTLGRAFFAESMFSRRTNASKAALIWLSAHLKRCGFVLWDTQYPNPHLASMGGQTIGRAAYRQRLAHALTLRADFTAHALPDVQALLQDTTQTS